MIDLNHNLTQTYAPWGVFGFEYDTLDQLVQASDPGYPAGGIPAGVTTYNFSFPGGNFDSCSLPITGYTFSSGTKSGITGSTIGITVTVT